MAQSFHPRGEGAKSVALVTGFQPFGPWTENTALWAARRAAESSLGAARFLALPVEYDASFEAWREAVARFRPAIALSLGMASTRSEVSIETTAFNEDNADLPDNAGIARRGSPIEAGGADSLGTDFPREALLARLRDAGFEANLSADAGRFVCNHLFYRAARALEAGFAPETRFAFVHIPGPATWTKAEAERFGESLGAWLAALVAPSRR
jgi:pyroglutamyl-peptidase